MSRRDPRITLSQMLAHAGEAHDLIEGKMRDHLDRERMLELALLRLLEVIGEAATRLPDEIPGFYRTLASATMEASASPSTHRAPTRVSVGSATIVRMSLANADTYYA